MRRSRVAQAGLVVSVGIGATRLRRPQSVTPPATDCGLAPALCPPLRRPPCDGAPRSGAVPPRRRIGIGLVPRPPRQRFDPALGATTFALAPRSGAVPPLGTTTLALGPRPSLWCRAPVTAFRHRSGAAPSGSGRLSRRDAAVRAALCWPRLRRSPFQTPTPRFWVVLQENGPEFDVISGFWAVVSVPRRDSRRWLRYNPRSEAFTSSMSRSAAYETAQNSAWVFRRPAHPGHRLPYETAQDFARAFGRRALDEHRVTYDAAQNFARALLRDSLARPTRYARRRDVPPTSGTCTAIGCRCWRRGGSRCRWAHRRVARFRVRRRNPAGQAQGLRSRVALRR